MRLTIGFILMWAFGVLLGCAWWSFIGWVIYHFVTKYW